MKILGISPLDKDATAAIYSDGDWAVIAEERLSRTKLHRGFPRRSLIELLKYCGLQPEQLDCVVYPFMPWWGEGSRIYSGYIRDLPFTLTNSDSWKQKFRHLRAYNNWCGRAIREHRKYHIELMSELRGL